MPSRACAASKVCQHGTAAATADNPAETTSDMAISRLRSMASDISPAISNVNARMPVVSNNDRLLARGEISNAHENSGVSGCTLYKDLDVAKPAVNNTILAE